MATTPTVFRLDDASDAPEARVRLRRFHPDDLTAMCGAGVSAFCAVWLVYERFTPLSGGLGFWLSWYAVFLALYWLIVRGRDGRMAATDRLATVVLTTAGLGLLVPLVLIVGYTVYKGWTALRPAFFVKDLRYTGSLSKGDRRGWSPRHRGHARAGRPGGADLGAPRRDHRGVPQRGRRPPGPTRPSHRRHDERPDLKR